MHAVWNDIRYAFRQFRKSPGFAITAVLTLALGIGVNAAVFTVFNKVLLHTMPVQNPGELVLLERHSKYDTGSLSTEGGDSNLYFAYPAYKYMRENNHVLQGLAADVPDSVNLVSAKDTDRVNVHMVTGNYFGVMALKPVLGRLIQPADDVFHAGNPVAVMTEDYWRSKFGGDPSILNQTVKINQTLFTIVGIVRHQGLLDDMQPAVFIPLAMEDAVRPPEKLDRLENPLFAWAVLVGRLQQGVSRMRAEDQLNVLWWNWRRDVLKEQASHIHDKTGWLQTHLSLRRGSGGVPVLEEMLEQPLQALSAMSLVVLLIACVNVANLLLVKAARKHLELAVRGALGASRSRIFQQVLAEGLLIGALGAAAGLLLGWVSLKLLLASIPQTNSLHDILQAPIDVHVAVFCTAMGIATSLLFSVAPALLSTHVNLLRALHGQAGSVATGGGWLRNLLVAGETALSLVLLMGAVLIGWNLYQLRHVHPGFATTHAMTFRIDASGPGRSDSQVEEEYETIQSQIQHLPGVYSVAYAMNGLLTGSESGRNVTVAGFKEMGKDVEPDIDIISAGFLSTMEIPLLAGREFTEHDTATSPRVAIVDEKFVQHYFGGDIQKALRGQFSFGGEKTQIQIVGVMPAISAVHFADVDSLPLIYTPYVQSFDTGGRSYPAVFYLRTQGNSLPLAGTLHDMLHRIDPDLPIPDFETMEDHMSDQIFETKLMALLALTMGGLALVLSAIGLYGVLAFAVGQRTREIGIRIALGADRANISTLVLRQVWLLAVMGLPVGALLGWGAIRLLALKDAQKYAAPLWLYVTAGTVLLVVMLAASYLPARRAASVDPMEALRSE